LGSKDAEMEPFMHFFVPKNQILDNNYYLCAGIYKLDAYKFGQMKLLSCILFVTIAMGAGTSLVAQSVQKGQTLLYDGQKEKTPIANVSIAATGAAAVVSNAQGEFELNFRTLHAGDDIHFRRIELNGYEVMNQEALEVARISRGMDATGHLKIVLVKREYLRQLREGYRSVAAKRYQKQLDEASAEAERLRQEGKLALEQYNERMNAIEEEYEAKLSKLESYIDKFARIDLSDLDEQEQQITALVQAGDFDAALKMYEDQNLSERLKKSQDDRAQLASAQSKIAAAAQQTANDNLRLRAAIDRQVTLLRMAGDDANILKAHQIIYQTYLADTTDYQARKDYGGSLADIGKYAEQIQLLKNGLAVEKDTIAQGMLMADIVIALWITRQPQEALLLATACDSLMSLIQTPNLKIASRILPLCARYQMEYYTNFGPLELGLQVADRARKFWAVDTLSEQSVLTHLGLLTCMSDIYTQSSRHEDVLWSIQESLSLSQIGDRRFPWSSSLGASYANACVSLMMEGQTVEALNAARQCSTLLTAKLEKSTMRNTTQWAAMLYFNVLEALTNANQYVLADSILQSEEKFKVFERLEQISPEQLPTIGMFRLFQSRICLNRNRIAEGKKIAEKAIALLKSDEYGSEFLPYSGNDIMARIALAEHRYGEAVEYCQQSIDYCKTAYAELQSAWEADNLCRQYLLLAEIHIAAGNQSKAKAAVKQAEKFASFASDRLYIEQIKKLLK